MGTARTSGDLGGFFIRKASLSSFMPTIWRRLDAKVSFYVWGERPGAENPIRSLGIFHNDDTRDASWVLTFDDPHVLAQIDSVFVTVESSKKTINEPGGREGYCLRSLEQAQLSVSKFRPHAVSRIPRLNLAYFPCLRLRWNAKLEHHKRVLRSWSPNISCKSTYGTNAPRC